MSSETSPESFVGRVLDERYRIDELIAHGGMATVYRAHDIRLGRTVALKILAPSLVSDPGFVDRFMAEARATAALMHPNVVAVHDQGVFDEFPYLVMEFVNGRTLREVLRDNGPMTPAHALEIMRSVLAGLASAHEAGFVHRDVKPENVLITRDGHVKVTDFGIARVLAAAPEDTATGSVILGTMGYVAPEYVANRQTDQRSDVYSAGILLFELLTGRVPFTANSPIDVAYLHVNNEVPAPSTYQPDIPPAVDHLVLGATKRNPNERMQSAREFQDGVNRALNAVPQAEALTTALPVGPTQIVERPATGSRHGARRATAAHPATPTNHRNFATAAHRRRAATNPNRRPRIILGSLVALGAIIFGWYTFSGSYVNMPPVSAMSVEQAAVILAPLELSHTVREEFSEDVPAGTIIASEPEAGVKARKGKAVVLVVSKGQERYVVPAELIGMDPNAASELLEPLTLTIGSTSQVWSDDIPLGMIVSTTPASGEKVKRATSIDLAISKGPEPVDVPKIVGESLKAATKALAKAGLEIDVTDEVFDESAVGTVLTVTPLPGTTVEKGSKVAVVISKGPALVEVPSVLGMSKSKAIETLEAAGFVVKAEKQLAVVVLNQVYSQDPAGGSMAPKGATITIKLV